MRQQRAYRSRRCPTNTQALALARTAKRARSVYNRGLRLRTAAWYARHERLTYPDVSTTLTLLKQQEETAWLT